MINNDSYRARDRYKIQGSLITDAAYTLCCPTCVSVQTANELDANNE